MMIFILLYFKFIAVKSTLVTRSCLESNKVLYMGIYKCSLNNLKKTRDKSKNKSATPTSEFRRLYEVIYLC